MGNRTELVRQGERLAEIAAALRDLPTTRATLYRVPSGKWVGGDVWVAVQVVRSQWQVGLDGKSVRVWHRRHAWCGRDRVVTARVRPSWTREVRNQGLAAADGLLTPDAGRLGSPGGVGLWAVRAEQGRGLGLRSRRGVITRRGTLFESAPVSDG